MKNTEPFHGGNEFLSNLPERLRKQADNVETDGWCSAARLMREAAFELEHYRAKM